MGARYQLEAESTIRCQHCTVTLRARFTSSGIRCTMKDNDIEVRYRHIQELIIYKKLKVQKVDIEVNIANSLTKLLSDQYFGVLKGLMALQQVSKRRVAERKEA